MNANKPASARTLKSDLKRVDAHKVKPSEYKDLPELTDAMLKRGAVRRAGRPVATDPRRQVTIRLPESVLEHWKATGPGWQTRMAALLSKRAS
ncbi:MAG: hypothetical protein EPN49_10410 [Rhodanobacter sp.]|nr:MAG: hypothetical protein EPN49_10410 [Rhodanobacter sp.]